MAARSSDPLDGAVLARLRAIGARCEGWSGETPAAPVALVAGLERLREAVDPEYLSPEHLEALEKRTRAAPRGFSGWADGQPYCGGCKAFIPHPGALCPQCGYMDGAGYVGVPAKTSHLERWR